MERKARGSKSRLNRLRLASLTQSSHLPLLFPPLPPPPALDKKNTPRGQKLTGQTSFLLSSPLDIVCSANQPHREGRGGTPAALPAFSQAKAPCGGSRRPERAKPRTPKTPAVASLVANRSVVTLSSDKPGLNPAGRLPVVPANDSNCDVACRSTDTDTVKTEGVFVSLFSFENKMDVKYSFCVASRSQCEM